MSILKRELIHTVVVGLLWVMLPNAYAAVNNDRIQVGRYVTMSNKPTRAQVNPLLAVISVTFPSDISTTEEAMDYLLRYSSYTLIPTDQRTQAEINMLKQPLPLVNRQFNAIYLQDALQVLAGKSVFTLIQDPLHRWVHFRLTKQAERLWGKHHV